MAIGHWLKNFTKWYFDPGAESGGGGGSSDFSIVQVTVVNNTSSDVSTYGPIAIIDDDVDNMNISQYTFLRGETSTIPMVMYKQSTYISLNTSGTITVEGSAEIDAPDVIITGDCTITIS